jgi:hypothetical protein
MASVKVSIRNNSLDDIEMDNFATEETLQAILDHLKENLKKELSTPKPSNHSTSPILNNTPSVDKDAVDDYNNAIKETGNGTEKLSGLLPLLAKGLTHQTEELELASLALTGFEAATDFAEKTLLSFSHTTGLLITTFADGKTQFNDYMQAITEGTKNIPIIGSFTALLGLASGEIQKWSDNLLDLNEVGLSFNGSLIDLVASARRMGLTTDQYTEILKKNIAELSTFGTVQAGQRKMTDVASYTLQNFSDQLSNAGISVDQYNQELPSILSLFGGSLKSSSASSKDLSLASLSLLDEFQKMAELTGKSRQAQEDQLKEETNDAAWQRHLNAMSASEQVNQNKVLAQMSAMYGKAGAEAYKLAVTGMPPLTKEQQILTATIPGLRGTMEHLNAECKNGTFSQASLNKSTARLAANTVAATNTFGTAIDAQSAGMNTGLGALSEFSANVYMHNQANIKNNKLNEKELENRLNNLNAQKAAGEDEQKRILDFNNKMKAMQDQFTLKVLIPLMEKAAPMLGKLIDFLSWLFTSKTGLITAGISAFVITIGGAVATMVTTMASLRLISLALNAILPKFLSAGAASKIGDIAGAGKGGGGIFTSIKNIFSKGTKATTIAEEEGVLSKGAKLAGNAEKGSGGIRGILGKLFSFGSKAGKLGTVVSGGAEAAEGIAGAAGTGAAASGAAGIAGAAGTAAGAATGIGAGVAGAAGAAEGVAGIAGASTLGTAGAVGAANFWNPIGWTIGGVLAVGAGAAAWHYYQEHKKKQQEEQKRQEEQAQKQMQAAQQQINNMSSIHQQHSSVVPGIPNMSGMSMTHSADTFSMIKNINAQLSTMNKHLIVMSDHMAQTAKYAKQTAQTI